MTDGNVLRRTVREFREDNLTDWAATLTYYGILAIFPMLIVLVSILGLVGTSATQPLIDNLGKVAPGPAQQIFTSAITTAPTAATRPATLTDRIPCPGLLPEPTDFAVMAPRLGLRARKSTEQRCRLRSFFVLLAKLVLSPV